MQHGLGDLHNLLLSHAQVEHQIAGIDAGLKLVKDVCGPAHLLAAVDHAVPFELLAGKHVVHDLHFGKQVELLMDDAHARRAGVAGVLKVHLFAVQKHLAPGGLFDAGENLHQRALARAVLADENVDLAGVDVKIHLVERQRAGIALGDADGLHDRLHILNLPSHSSLQG